MLLVAAVAVYNSVTVEKLDVKRDREKVRSLSPKDLATNFWNSKLDDVLQSAIALETFDSLLAVAPRALMQQHGKAVGITSLHCFLVKGSALFGQPGTETLPVVFKGKGRTYHLLMKRIVGNAARDALGAFNIDDFQNTMDFNAVATALNALIQERVITDGRLSMSAGQMIRFVGAVEVQAEGGPKEIAIIPLKLEVFR